MKKIKTLAIETSCDDTSVWIISFDWNRFEVEKLLSYSQIKEHSEFGWVVPEVASRLHEEKILAILQNIWLENIKKVDFISVTGQPGLPGSLIVWKTVANTLWVFLNKEVVEVNHIFGHIFSIFLERNIDEINFPLVVLTASGGHNDIWMIEEKIWNNFQEDNQLQAINKHFSLSKVGYTLDDAAGEAFDKVARMLWWPYPGWPWISKIAKDNIELDKYILDLIKKRIKPIFLSADKFEFSFSGFKSQVWYLLQDLEKKWKKLDDQLKSYIAYVFQEAVVEVLAKKLIQAAIKYNAKSIAIVGWVSANERLWQYLNELVDKKIKKWQINKDVKLFRPVKKVYSTDNAAMIGVVGILLKQGVIFD